ncbi:membrane protein insertase YidC [Oceanobacter mangrovi]|uniref:membrane protein insertase YidC n=1 Tax=Oceanobacter mangrovi TaxID=2862510 RepID=UPI001C8D2747|nr:membrane protein insertase YidC [Oceanobacter mangrovi]
MDIRRTVIYIGLAISSYFLFINWNNDYGHKADANLPVSEQQVQSTDAPVSDAASQHLDQPAVTAAGLPSDSLPAATGQTIEVSTDVLTVSINPRGGEITQVLLPAFPISVDHPETPSALLENNSRRLYVAQSGLVGRDGTDTNGAALFASEQTSYQMLPDQDQLQVVLTTQTDKAIVEKIFTFKRGEYLFDISYRVHNTSDSDWSGVFYAQLKRDGSADPSKQSSMGMSSYLGAALTTSENRYEKIKFSDLEDKPYKSVQEGGWAAILQHYFLAAWIPNPDASHTYNGRFVRGNYIFGFFDQPFTVAAGETAETGAKLYVGPKDQDRLGEIAENLNLTVDYGWLWFIAQPLFHVLTFFHGLVGNWGVAIILLTFCVKLLFFYPSAMSYRSMANMRKVAPEMQAIKEKYGDNREKLGQEMMKLYRDKKINPLGGCLPILIQMPVFISLYWVLMESIELRQAPFALWIKDMSVMDPYFILPLIMGASMFLQMKLNPTPPDPMQARVMQFMPIVFTIFFLWFPAGLVLYWVCNNVLSISQQYVITKQIEKAK